MVVDLRRPAAFLFQRCAGAHTLFISDVHCQQQGYTEVVLCGIDECGCVGATAEGAARRGLKVVMLSSAIGSRFPNSKIEKRRHSLKALGVDYIG